jgi:hypothetical protein
MQISAENCLTGIFTPWKSGFESLIAHLLLSGQNSAGRFRLTATTSLGLKAPEFLDCIASSREAYLPKKDDGPWALVPRGGWLGA